MKIWNLSVIMVCSQICLAQPQPDTLWTRQFGSDMDETVYGLCPIEQGGYVMAGHLGYNGDDIGPQDIFVYRTDVNGDSVWSQIIGVPEIYEFAHAMCIGGNGDIMLAGMQWAESGLNAVARLIRLDPQGNIQYDHTYGDSTDRAQFYGVVELPGGDVVAAGYHYTAESNANAYLIRVNPAGDTVWTRSLGDSLREHFTELVLAPEGHLILAGIAWSVEPGSETSFLTLMEVDSDGNLLWSRRYESGFPFSVFTMPPEVALLPGGDLAIGATIFDGTMALAWLMRASADGDSLWAYTYHFGPISNFTYDVSAGAVGGIVAVIGTIYYPSYALALMNVDDAGQLVWEQDYALAERSVWITGLRACPNTSYLISGTSFDNSNRYQVMLMMTGPEIPETTRETTAALLREITLSVYPNPFNAQTSISFDLPRALSARVILYDVTGRQERVIRDQTFGAGEHHLTFDASGLASGIHIVTLKSDHVLATEKLLLLK